MLKLRGDFLEKFQLKFLENPRKILKKIGGGIPGGIRSETHSKIPGRVELSC